MVATSYRGQDVAIEISRDALEEDNGVASAASVQHFAWKQVLAAGAVVEVLDQEGVIAGTTELTVGAKAGTDAIIATTTIDQVVAAAEEEIGVVASVEAVVMASAIEQVIAV